MKNNFVRNVSTYSYVIRTNLNREVCTNLKKNERSIRLPILLYV